MTRKTGLGRGLDALIPGGTPKAQPVTNQIPVSKIITNPQQPREHIQPEALAELAASIKEHGILQPLLVSHDEEHNRYILIAGERRLMAAIQAGLEQVPAVVREVTPQEQLELALIENLQRADLNPIEAAKAYQRLMDDFQLSHAEIAKRVGKSRTTITNTLRLMRLPEVVKQALLEGKISEGHARALLALPTPEAQKSALHTVLQLELSVRQAEALVRKLSGKRPPSTPKAPIPPEITALEEKLRMRFGTKVRLNPRRKGGTVVIHYYSHEELDSLITKLLGEMEN